MLKIIQHYLAHSGVFASRIRARHNQFWNTPNAEAVRNTVMHADNTLDEWMDCENWQRKLSNKLNAREFATKFGCKVALLYWKGRDIENINFELLPANYVIRPTIGHSSRSVFLMRNGYNLFDKRFYQSIEIREILQEQIRQNENLHFLIEEFLTSESGQTEILKDYKLFCFNGEVACICVIDRLGPLSGTACFYDVHWNLMPQVNKNYLPGKFQTAPKCLNNMLAQARILSQAYKIFVRLDFYATTNGAVFGEFTPTPSMGGKTTKYGRKLLIAHWDKYCNGLV